MDRSLSFSSTVSGSLTRDHSPDNVRRKLAELESNLSALGHVGLVKHQRDLLKTELKKQTYLTDDARQSASRLRKLALRLAIHVSVKDSKLSRQGKALNRSRFNHYLDGRDNESNVKQLLSVLRRYERQGEELLKELNKRTSSGKSAESSAHGLLYPSPPPSPRSQRSSTRSSTASDLSASINFGQLPSEIFQICKERVDSLLNDYRDGQDTITELRDAQAALNSAIGEHEDKVRSLENDKTHSAAALKKVEEDLAGLCHELEGKAKAMNELEAAKSLAEQDVRNHKRHIQTLQTSHARSQERAAALEKELSTIHNDYQSGKSRVAQLQEALTVGKKAIKDHEKHIEVLKSSDKEAHHRFNAAQIQIANLREEYRKSQDALVDARQAQLDLEEKKSESEWRLEASRTAQRETAQELKDMRAKLDAANDAQSRIAQDLKERSASLEESRSSEKSLKEIIQKHEKTIRGLEATRKQLQDDFKAAHSLLANFAQTAARLRRELETEKHRSRRLSLSESQLKSVVQDYEEKNRRLQGQVDDLGKQLAAEKAGHGGTSKAHEELKSKFEEAKEMLWNSRTEYEDRIGALIAAEVLLKAELEEMKSRSRTAEGARDGLALTIEEHKAELESLKREHEDKIGLYLTAEVFLKADLEAARSKSKAAEETKARLEAALEEVKASSERSGAENQTRLAELQQQCSKVQQDLEAAVDECKALISTKGNLNSALESERDRASDLREQLEEKANKIAELDSLVSAGKEEVRSLNVTTNELERAKYILETDLSDARQEATQAQDELKSLQETHQDLEAKLQDEVNERVKLNREINRLRASSQSLRDEIERIKSELAAALESSDLFQLSSSAAEAKVEELQRQLAGHETRLSDFQKREAESLDKSTAADAFRQSLEDQLAESKSTVGRLESQVTELKARANWLEKAKAELEEDLSSARSELEGTKNDNVTLQDELERHCASQDALEEQLKRTKSRVEGLENELRLSQEASRVAEERAERLTSGLDTARLQITRLEEENTDLSKQLEEASKDSQRQIAQLEDEKAAIAGQLEEHRNTVATLESKHRNLRLDLTAAEEAKTALRRQLEEHRDSADGQLSQLKAQKAAMAARLEEQRTTVTVLDAKHRDLTTELAAAAKAKVTLHHQLEEHKAKFKEHLQSSQDKISQIEEEKKNAIGAELEERRAIVSFLESKHRDLTSELAAATEAKLSLTQQLEDHQRTIDSLSSRNTDLASQLATATEAKNQWDVEKGASAGMFDTLQAALESLEEENQAMRSENLTLQERIRRSQTIRTSHERALGSVRVRLGTSKMSQRNAQAKLAAAQKEFVALMKQNATLESSLSAAIVALDAAKHEREEKDTLSAQRSKELEDAVADLRQQNQEELRQFEASIAAITAELDAAKLEAAERDSNALESLKQLQQMIDKMKEDKLASEREAEDRLATAMSQLENEKREGLARDEAAASAAKGLEANVAELQSHKQDLQEQLSATQTTVSALKEALERSQREGKHLKNEVVHLSLALGTSEEQIAGLKTELEHMTHLNNIELQSLQAKDARIAELRREKEEAIAHLKSQLHRQQESHTADLQVVGQKEDEIKRLKQENQQWALESSSLKSAVALRESTVTDLSRQLAELQKTASESGDSPSTGVRDSLTDRDLTIETLRAQVQTQRRQVDSANERSRELEHGLAARDSQTDKLRMLNRDYASLVASLQAEVRDLRQSNDRLTSQMKELRGMKTEFDEEDWAQSRPTWPQLRPKSAPVLSFAPAPQLLSKKEARRSLSFEDKDDLPEQDEDQLSEYHDTIQEVDEDDAMSGHPEPASSPTAVGTPTPTTISYASPSSPRRRTISSSMTQTTRVPSRGSAKSLKIERPHSLKAYQVLGAEAATQDRLEAETQSPTEESEMKKRLWDLWESQRQQMPSRDGPVEVHVRPRKDIGSIGERERPSTMMTALHSLSGPSVSGFFGGDGSMKRSRKKLQKKRRTVSEMHGGSQSVDALGRVATQDDLVQRGEQEHGRLWNFVHLGSLRRRPQEGRPMTRG